MDNQEHLIDQGIEIQENQNYLFAQDLTSSQKDEIIDYLDERG